MTCPLGARWTRRSDWCRPFSTSTRTAKVPHSFALALVCCSSPPTAICFSYLAEPNLPISFPSPYPISFSARSLSRKLAAWTGGDAAIRARCPLLLQQALLIPPPPPPPPPPVTRPRSHLHLILIHPLILSPISPPFMMTFLAFASHPALQPSISKFIITWNYRLLSPLS